MPSSRPASWTRGALRSLAVGALCVSLVLLRHFTHAPATGELSAAPLQQRDVSPVATFDITYAADPNPDELCRQVHKAEDQCAFIRENCPKDEGGFSEYLELYFCTLSHIKPVVFIGLVLWLALLFNVISVAASDFFCLDLNVLADILGMEQTLTGVTLLAFGNGSPDVFSTFAAMRSDSSSLAVGELFGAAGFIASVVAGTMAFVQPFEVTKNSFLRDVGFFTVAAAFSMIFLWDGKLHFWECVVMVAFYLFYVVFVVIWHTLVSRKKGKQEREAAARGHFDHDQGGHIHQDAHAREDWSALERGEPAEDDYQDIEEEGRNKWLSEFNSNMRLTRPNARSRRNTGVAIRPSLLGALEFQALVRSLRRSQNLRDTRTIPMDPRRRSDELTLTDATQDHISTFSDSSTSPFRRSSVPDENSPLLQKATHSMAPHFASLGRTRAVSANDAATLRLSSQFRPLSPVQSEDNLIDLAQEVTTDDSAGAGVREQRPSPTVLVEPATPRRESSLQQVRGRSPTAPSGSLLAPPETVSGSRPHSDHFLSISLAQRQTLSPMHSPQLVPRVSALPPVIIPRANRSPGSSRSTSPFPPYRDSPSPALTASSASPSAGPPSIHLPEPLASPESLPVDQAAEREVPRRPSRLERIWPKSFPPPSELISTLFPAFYQWKQKSIVEKLIGLYSAPTVFVLTVTLPVVESEESQKTKSKTIARSGNVSKASVKSASSSWPAEVQPHAGILSPGGVNGKADVATVATETERHRANASNNMPRISVSTEPDSVDYLDPQHDEEEEDSESWGRWLTIVQLFTAPILVVFAIYLQAEDAEPSWLLRPVLICLLFSTVLLIPLLLTTTPTYRPACYRWILSSVGFVVAVAWISTVASQVVGALKAVGVICNMSHAILGLTIFAVGNSCGDLVSDITVARVGYPVMAFSACFAGPMMNILLGIGLSGSYRLITGEERRRHKHPEKGIRFKSYHIEVSKTLIVSGITLLITLIGLLIVVPLNKWVMDRKIGTGLILLWAFSTAFNVVIEVTGLLDEAEAFLKLWSIERGRHG